jgi:hypothetical protein
MPIEPCTCSKEDRKELHGKQKNFTTVSLEFDMKEKLFRVGCHRCWRFTNWYRTEQEALDEWNHLARGIENNG